VVAIENGSGTTLNRVTGTEVSHLDGRLTASGSVYLVNGNGVVIGRSGVVETGGTFVASSLDIDDRDFLKGGERTLSASSVSEVINLGKVGSLGGNVALVASVVINSGEISAANGTVGLLAGNAVLLRDRANDQGALFSVLVGGPGTRASNGGTIAAASAELRAQQGNVYALAGNAAGSIQATAIRLDQGRIWLVSESGSTQVAGSLSARGSDGSPGWIETSGHGVQLEGASIDAHGGTWLVDPENLIVDAAAAGTIGSALGGGTDVTLTTGASGASAYGSGDASEAGDIIVNSAISWTSAARLTLDSYHGITVNAQVDIGGAGKLTLVTNHGGSGGDLQFAPGKSVTFLDNNAGQSLIINGDPYTLIHTPA